MFPIPTIVETKRIMALSDLLNIIEHLTQKVNDLSGTNFSASGYSEEIIEQWLKELYEKDKILDNRGWPIGPGGATLLTAERLKILNNLRNSHETIDDWLKEIDDLDKDYVSQTETKD